MVKTKILVSLVQDPLQPPFTFSYQTKLSEQDTPQTL